MYKRFVFLATLILLLSACNKNSLAEIVSKKAFQELSSIESNPEEISILFIGDIMQHTSQIEEAYRPKTDSYDFSNQFEYIKEIIGQNDVTIANLEVSFGGAPYAGYPRFSSPDALIDAIKDAGIKYLVTANNHVCDNGKFGLERTLGVIDNAGIVRTGIYKNAADKQKNQPMIINEKGFRIAVLNYTYGTNENPFEAPNIVNIIDTNIIKKDLISLQDSNFDAVIVFPHWGIEYQRVQDSIQERIADLCFRYDADLVVGSHPHVIQPFKRFDYVKSDSSVKNVLVAYSLGNFVSNYDTWRYCDGGAMLRVVLRKNKNKKAELVGAGYILVWVYKLFKNGFNNHFVVPVSMFEKDKTMSQKSFTQLWRFINDSRSHLDSYNLNVPEYIFDSGSNEWIYRHTTK